MTGRAIRLAYRNEGLWRTTRARTGYSLGDMNAALRLQGVRKTFGSATAVHDLDLEVPTGALYGVIGPNGAGKTTTIRLIMSILFPDAGELSVLGHRSALDAKNRIGYLPEERGVYRKMHVGAFLTYMAQLKGVAGSRAYRARVGRGLERVGLGGTEKKRCEELSKGMLQKVQFLAAIIHQPDSADPRRAVQRPRPGQLAAAARAGAGGAPPRRDHPAVDARDDPGGRDLRARRDDPPRPQGARRQRRRRSAGATIRARFCSSRWIPRPT